MIVRLAFAIIANIDADILVIDEALCCWRRILRSKMYAFYKSIRESNTLIFVSHDPTAVTAVARGHCFWKEEPWQ